MKNLSLYVSEEGQRYSNSNALALWNRLGIRPGPVIQETPQGYIVVVGPFRRRVEALKVAFELTGLDCSEG